MKSTIFPNDCTLPLKEFIKTHEIKVRTVGIGTILPWSYDVVKIESAPSQQTKPPVSENIAIAFVSIFKQNVIVLHTQCVPKITELYI